MCRTYRDLGIIFDSAVKSVKPDAMLSSSKPDKDDIDDLMKYRPTQYSTKHGKGQSLVIQNWT